MGTAASSDLLVQASITEIPLVGIVPRLGICVKDFPGMWICHTCPSSAGGAAIPSSGTPHPDEPLSSTPGSPEVGIRDPLAQVKTPKDERLRHESAYANPSSWAASTL